jgi:hypothetical protein
MNFLEKAGLIIVLITVLTITYPTEMRNVNTVQPIAFFVGALMFIVFGEK